MEAAESIPSSIQGWKPAHPGIQLASAGHSLDTYMAFLNDFYKFYTRTYIHMYIHVYTYYVNVYICVYVYTCTYTPHMYRIICTCAYIYAHTHWIYVCVYACAYMCAYTQACIYQAYSRTRVSHKLLQSCTRAGPGQNSRWDLGVRSNRMR